MSKKLLIGIPGFQNAEKMFGVTGNYMQFAASFGDVRIIMPHEEYVPVDLLILPGGMDLSPSSYGQIPGYKTGNHDVFKEFFFKERLKNYVDNNTKIFGICLGFQMLNTFFGGTLHQDLIWHPQSNSRWAEAHDVILTSTAKEKTPKKIKVNSHHHQCVMEEGLAPDLNAIAQYEDAEGLIIEAFMHKTLPIGGVQWHPEELYDGWSASIIKNLLAQ